MKRNSVLLLSCIIACIAIRAWFWNATNLTLEDALISFRYAGNIASGNGFVYNHGERVLGTSTPLWTLILAAANIGGFTDTITTAKILGILFDCIALILFFRALQEVSGRYAAALWAALFIASPEIVPVTVSGMETSLVLSGMALMFYGLTRKNYAFVIGAAVVV
jgi:hypothetical protein